LLACLEGQGSCCIQSACSLIGILREAQTALFTVLEKYTLADLLQREQPLATILMHPRAVSSDA
ncbi:MAG TPA: Rrf2 family transcriptional regulator, partial [Methylophilaceae bacterium]|nr:Rrf2 family transcriptional regulator [Methylophilaceae bacterium]